MTHVDIALLYVVPSDLRLLVTQLKTAPSAYFKVRSALIGIERIAFEPSEILVIRAQI